jgi:hypothetical protein
MSSTTTSLWVGLQPDKLLSVSASLWFSVATLGQWLFALYVLSLYGARLFVSGLPGLADTHLTNSYVAGDALGNVAVAAHVLIAAVIHGGGPLQFMPQIRRHAPRVHHWIGRAFLLAAITGSMTGLYMIWVRGTGGTGLLNSLSNTIATALIVLFATLALRNALARNIAVHRRWALRLFLVASAVWFARLGIWGTGVVAPAFGVEFKPIMMQVVAIMDVLKIAVPLAVCELFFWAQGRAGPNGKFATAAVLLLTTLVTAVGIYGAATLVWWPRAYG